MGAYYNDPNGTYSVYVNDGETPAQALDRVQRDTGVQFDESVIRSVNATPAAHIPMSPAHPAATPHPVNLTPEQQAAGGGKVTSITPAYGTPKISFPVIRSKIAPVITGEPISTAVLTGLSAIFTVFGLFGGSNLKKAVSGVISAVKDITNTLMNFIWTMSHIARWILNALRQLWEKVLGPLIDHVNSITQKIAAIIMRVLRPYLDLIQKIRKHILEIYARFLLPVIRVIQQIRVMLAILRLAHVPGVKELDAKLAKIEGKIIGTLQAIMSRINDHGGLLNILMTVRNTIQHGVLIRSMYETQGAWVNQWWNAQEWDRSPEDEKAAADLELAIQAQSEVKELDQFLSTRIYVSTHIPGPEEQALTSMLMRGRA